MKNLKITIWSELLFIYSSQDIDYRILESLLIVDDWMYNTIRKDLILLFLY